MSYFYNRGQDHAAYGWVPNPRGDWTEGQLQEYRKGFDDYHQGIVVDQRKH